MSAVSIPSDERKTVSNSTPTVPSQAEPEQQTVTISEDSTVPKADDTPQPGNESLKSSLPSQLSLDERLKNLIKFKGGGLAPEPDSATTLESSRSSISLSVNGSKEYLVPWRLCHTWHTMLSFLRDLVAPDEALLADLEDGNYSISCQLQFPRVGLIVPEVWECVVSPGTMLSIFIPASKDDSPIGLNESPAHRSKRPPRNSQWQDSNTESHYDVIDEVDSKRGILYSVSCYQTGVSGLRDILFSARLQKRVEIAEAQPLEEHIMEEKMVINSPGSSDSNDSTEQDGNKFILPADAYIESIDLKIHSTFLLNVLRAVVQFSTTRRVASSSYPPVPRLAGEEDGDSYSRGIFRYPYRDLFSHLDDILRYKEDVKGFRALHTEDYNEKCDSHIDALVDYLYGQNAFPFHEYKLQWAKPIPTTEFGGVWLLLKPGKDVYCRQNGSLAAFVIDEVRGGVDYDPRSIGTAKLSTYEVLVWDMVFDGRVIGRRSTKIIVSYFDGERDITSLPVFPADIQDKLDGGSTRDQLVARGRKYFGYSKAPKFLEYSGPGSKAGWKTYNHARVIVEHASRPWKRPEFTNTAWNMTLHKTSATQQSDSNRLLPPLPPPPPLGQNLRAPTCECFKCKAKASHGPFTIRRFDGYDEIDPKEVVELTDHQYYLLTSHMYGYVLKDRAYDILDINGLRKPRIIRNAIDRLVMDATDKGIIKAIAKSYTQNEPETKVFSADFISGKGEGQIVLLHGPPGTGKTLTAESVAEYTKRPLLSITAADLGDNPERLEKNLLSFFRNAHDWDAIVLLDEADIYLETRSAENLRRNSIVSVFLRALDYFQGILFLTTNRVGQFDEAFLSRIHVSIGYERLDDSARAEIWGNLFDKLDEDHKRGGMKILYDIHAQEYVTKSEDVLNLKWNGREIRNAFQTAVALAVSDCKEANEKKDFDSDDLEDNVPRVKQQHLAKVVKLSTAFKKYIKSTHRMGDSDYAFHHGNRDDDHETVKRSKPGQRGNT